MKQLQLEKYLPEHLYFNILEQFLVARKLMTSLFIISEHKVNGSEKKCKIPNFLINGKDLAFTRLILKTFINFSPVLHI